MKIDYFEDANHPSSLKQASSVELLYEGLPRLLRVVSIYIAFDEIAFHKLLKKVIESLQEATP